MMIGTVNADREATLRLIVHSANGQEREIETVLDTGFNGLLTLPPHLITELFLPVLSFGFAILADGSEIQFDVHGATILWDGVPISILVASADTDPLIGMELLYGYNINIDAVDGGPVTISRLTP